MIRFIGDVHGKFNRYQDILKESPHRTIQVGDLGVGFRRFPHGEWDRNPRHELMVEKNAMFIRGNHDSPPVCRNHSQCIADGTVIDNMMFVGGALSIDRVHRHEKFSWWEDEELSPEQLDIIVKDATRVQAPIMVTHECPESVAELVVQDIKGTNEAKLDPRFASRTRVAFQQIFEAYQPKLWIFGHWHVPFDRVENGTRFVCLPELATFDVETERF